MNRKPGAGRAAARAAIFGLAGFELGGEERRFFAETGPFGFILFARNCAEPAQVRALVEDLRASVDRPEAPVLIDQEGGRVQRLRPPHWRAAPPAGRIGRLCAVDQARGCQASWLNARLIAAELGDLGIDVDCAPVLDVRHPLGHDVIGDRAFGFEPAGVAALARATCAGLLDGGVLPVLKHIPGHGRAAADSHFSLPVVDAPLAVLQSSDFAPFRALAEMPLAMTAHVVYGALDPTAPATTSAEVIESIIRRLIGFDGLLISDDLCMRALAGTPGERTRAALAAGCDVVLHCNGDLPEMRQVAEVCPPLTPAASARAVRALAMRRAPLPFDVDDGIARLASLLGAEAIA